MDKRPVGVISNEAAVVTDRATLDPVQLEIIHAAQHVVHLLEQPREIDLLFQASRVLQYNVRHLEHPSTRFYEFEGIPALQNRHGGALVDLRCGY
jgi:hypothetical protein